MKLHRFFLTMPLVAAVSASTAHGAIIISEIMDGDLTGGLPKFVELTNTGSGDFDLSTVWIGNFNNGGTTLGGGAASQLSGTVASGDSYVIGYESGEPDVTFAAVFGFAPDLETFGAFINGDDVVALFDGPATGDGTNANIIDIYGVIGVNGDNEAWDYTDSYAFRKSGVITGNGGTFNASEWSFAGRSALDGTDAAAHAAAGTPGTHNIPEPTTTLLGALGLLAILRRRR